MHRRRVLVLGIVFAVSVVFSNCSAMEPNDYPNVSQWLKTSREIKMINLFNELNISQAQMKQMGRILKKGFAETDRLDAEIGELVSTYSQYLVELKTALMSGTKIPENLSPKILGIEEKLDRKCELFEKTHSALPEDIRGVLNDSQKKIVEDFVPYLVPQANEIGKEETTGSVDDLLPELETQISAIRATSENSFPKEKQKFIANFSQKALERAIESDESINQEEFLASEMERLGDFIDQIRELSDEDYEARKSEILAEILPGNSSEVNEDWDKVEEFLVTKECLTLIRARFKK